MIRENLKPAPKAAKTKVQAKAFFWDKIAIFKLFFITKKIEIQTDFILIFL